MCRCQVALWMSVDQLTSLKAQGVRLKDLVASNGAFRPKTNKISALRQLHELSRSNIYVYLIY